MRAPRQAGLGLLAAAALIATPAESSTEESWTELFTVARAACLEAVNLSGPRVLAEPLVFDQVLVMLIKGLWPQEHMRTEPPASFVCVYDRVSGNATAQEAGIDFPAD